MWIAGYFDADSVVAWLWEPHNIHRIVPTKLAVILDIELFQGALIPIAIASITMLVGWTLVLLSTVVKACDLERNEFIAFLCLFLVLSFQTFTLDSFTYPVNSQFPFSIFLFVCAVCAGIKAACVSGGDSKGARWLLSSLLAAVACSTTAFNGLLVWLVLIYLCWKRRYTLGVVAFSTVGTIFIALYLPGLTFLTESPAQGNVSESMYHFGRYFIAYFGMPWVVVSKVSIAGYLIGATVVFLALRAFLEAGFDRNDNHTLQDIGLAFLLFSFLTAAMTTVGRSADFDLPAHRYTIIAVVGHLGLLCFYWPSIWRHIQAAMSLRAGQIALVFVSTIIVCHQLAIGMFAYNRATEFGKIKDRILAGDKAVQVVEKVYFDYDEYLNHLELMRRERVYLYRELSRE